MVENKNEPAIELLHILNFQKKSKGTNKIRITRVVGLMMYHGHAAVTTYYHINKLIKKGYIWKSEKSKTERYLELLDTIPFEAMIKQVSNMGNIMCDYKTFLMHLREYPSNRFLRTELEAYMRDKIHEGFTGGNFLTWFKKACDEGIIGNTREKLGPQRPHLYTVIPEKHNPYNIPTIKNGYEQMIINILKKNGPMFWRDLKPILEDKVGIPLSAHMKVRRALMNLHFKKYLILESGEKLSKNRYSLNPVYNFG